MENSKSGREGEGGGEVAWLTARMADGVSVASAWPLAANFLVPPHSPPLNRCEARFELILLIFDCTKFQLTTIYVPLLLPMLTSDADVVTVATPAQPAPRSQWRVPLFGLRLPQSNGSRNLQRLRRSICAKGNEEGASMAAQAQLHLQPRLQLLHHIHL